jgi:predicted RNA-binding Zn-ribbon protein involved in translation (DUF1610 family)
MLRHEAAARTPRNPFSVGLPCPKCGRAMQLRRSTAETDGICEIHTYGCGECGVWTAADPYVLRLTEPSL